MTSPSAELGSWLQRVAISLLSKYVGPNLTQSPYQYSRGKSQTPKKGWKKGDPTLTIHKGVDRGLVPKGDLLKGPLLSLHEGRKTVRAEVVATCKVEELKKDEKALLY